jgi:hypothetical protein
MHTIKINNGLNLGLERDEKKVRLVVLDNKKELACRKETFGNLQKFIAANNAHAFKGRLQLLKHHDTISVEVKGEKLGAVAASTFGNCLVKLKAE